MKRAILIVLDSAGVGYMPDARKYGDYGADTLGNIDKNIKIKLPNMEKLGLGCLKEFNNIKCNKNPEGNFGKMAEKSKGKDTITGHWEIAGLVLDRAFPVYPEGFPKEVINKFKKVTGYDIIGNYASSGTVILEKLGKKHLESKKPIVYTSADSVFQIAAHEKIIPVKELYDICEKAREILISPHNVGRVIARPFVGDEQNGFKRTTNRKDFPIKPHYSMLDCLKENNLEVVGVGKIEDIYCGQGLTESLGHNENNYDGMIKTLNYIKKNNFNGLLFLNLVDFDMKYGHRNDIEGYANALEEFDNFLPQLINNISDDDILIITADHGCDPSFKGTDHTREYVPLLVYGKRLKKGINLGIRSSFADAGATVLDYFGLDSVSGQSFLEELKGDARI
ncbi:MAG: phosphopentomutase [Candidatus Muiribacteriota bacterium]